VASPAFNTETVESFVQQVEVWTPKERSLWQRTVADRFGMRSENVSTNGSFAMRHRLVSRVLGTARAEVLTREGAGGYDVAVALPIFRVDRLDSIVVLACQGVSERGGAVEIWEPNSRDDLVHAEGYYGALQNLEFSSRLARFRKASGLPGITWDRKTPYLISDVRSSPAFLRVELAREHQLSVGLGIPILRRDDVAQVIAFVTASNTPPAALIEVWIPDASGRLWLDQSVHSPGYESLARASRSTCFMRGEGLAGQAADTRRPIAWVGPTRDAHPLDVDACRAGLERGVAIPIVGIAGTRAVLVLRM
jgi:hypothetical protein